MSKNKNKNVSVSSFYVETVPFLNVLREAGVDVFPGTDAQASSAPGPARLTSSAGDDLVVAYHSLIMDVSADEKFMNLKVSFDVRLGASTKQRLRVPLAQAAPVAEMLLLDLFDKPFAENNSRLATMRSFHLYVNRSKFQKLLHLVAADALSYRTYVSKVETKVERLNKQCLSRQVHAAAFFGRRLDWLISAGLDFEVSPIKDEATITSEVSGLSREVLAMLLVFGVAPESTCSVLTEGYDVPGFVVDALTRMRELHLTMVGVSDEALSASVAQLMDDPYGWVDAGKNRNQRRARSLLLPPSDLDGPSVAIVESSDWTSLSGRELASWGSQNWESLTLEEAGVLVGKLEQSHRIFLVRSGGAQQTFWFSALKLAVS